MINPELNKSIIESGLKISRLTQILLLAFGNMNGISFKDNLKIGSILYQLKQKPEYEQLLSKIKFQENELLPENHPLYISLENMVINSLLNYNYINYSLGSYFSEHYAIARELAIEEGIKANLLEKFANEFKQEITKIKVYKK